MQTFSELLAYPLLAVYYLTVVGLDPFQLALVGIVLQVTVFVFEVPTGVVADTVSRRLSIVIGFGLLGAGFALEGLVPQLGVILLAQVVRGLGQTFLSGATVAWIADEVGEARAAAALVRGAQAKQVGVVLGALVCAAFAALSVSWPIVVCGVLLILLGLGLAVTMPETGFKPLPQTERASWRALGRTLQSGLALVRARPPLGFLLGAAAFIGFYFEGLDRFWEAHFVKDIVLPTVLGLATVSWFSIFNLGAMLSDLAGLSWATRAMKAPRFQMDGVLLGGYALTALGMMLFGLTTNFPLALGAFWGLCLLGGVARPLNEIWLNHHITSAVRATVLSLHSQVLALGQLLGGLALGLLAANFSIGAALFVGGLALLPALWCFRRSASELPVVD